MKLAELIVINFCQYGMHLFQTNKFVIHKSSENCDGRDLVLLAVSRWGLTIPCVSVIYPLPDKQQTSLEPFCITFRENRENVNIPKAASSEQGWQYWGRDLYIGCLRRTRTCKLVPFVFFWNHEGHVCHRLNKLNIIHKT